jgi:hypothetical protein
MDKNKLIEQYEDTVRNHFYEGYHRDIPVVIPYFNAQNAFSGIFTGSQYPTLERYEISWEDWQQYLKKQQYISDFENLVND